MTPCFFDWGIAGSWATALATVALAVVAGVQLGRFTKGDRLKRTLKYVDDYYIARYLVPLNEPTSVALSMFTLSGTVLGGKVTPEYEKLSTSHSYGNPKYHLLNSAAIIPINYFQIVASLAKSNLIDVPRFLDFFAPQIVKTWEALEALVEVEPGLRPGLDNGDFRALVGTAKAFIRANAPAAPQASSGNS